MKHADLELTKYAYESPDGGKTVYRREHGSMNRELMGDIYEQKASELDVSVDYYVSEFL